MTFKTGFLSVCHLFHLPVVQRIKASFACFPAKNIPNMERGLLIDSSE